MLHSRIFVLSCWTFQLHFDFEDDTFLLARAWFLYFLAMKKMYYLQIFFSIIGIKHWTISNYECLCYMISNCLCFFILIGYAKPYLLKWSTIVKRYGYFLSSVILESSSTVSAWYHSYHELDFIYLIILDLFLNVWIIWHDSHVLQNSNHSSYIFCQNTFRLLPK